MEAAPSRRRQPLEAAVNSRFKSISFTFCPFMLPLLNFAANYFLLFGKGAILLFCHYSRWVYIFVCVCVRVEDFDPAIL